MHDFELANLWKERKRANLDLFVSCCRRLEATVNGSDSWLNKQLETDEEMKKEVTNQDIIKEVLSPPPI